VASFIPILNDECVIVNDELPENQLLQILKIRNSSLRLLSETFCDWAILAQRAFWAKNVQNAWPPSRPYNPFWAKNAQNGWKAIKLARE
jgi:hypothetical protein